MTAALAELDDLELTSTDAPLDEALHRPGQPVADVLAAGVASGPDGARPDALAAWAAGRYGVDLDAVLAGERVTGKAGEVVRVPVQAPDGLPTRLLLVGTGAGRPEHLRRAAAALARAARGRAWLATSLGSGTGAEGARAIAEGLVLGRYVPPSSGVKDRADSAPVHAVLLLGRHPEAGLVRGMRHAAATVTARNLANTPSSVKDPAWMVARAREVADRADLRIEVWDAGRLAADGFGGLLAVGAGSVSPPALVRLDYTRQAEPAAGRAGAQDGPIVLVGKGITFDTGGLSIKPREAMVPMKTDMAGAAAVLAVLGACRDLGVRRPVTGLLPLAENAFGGSSYRPGDVVRPYGGRSVEVANTDAEGRLVLADALSYADRTLDPALLVDVATLTGAASLGLGRRHGALFAGDERLAAALLSAGQDSGERLWRLPLVEDYRPALDSSVADLRQVPADRKVGGGSITAALFLREFTGARRWAHLDIAGPARADKDEYEVTRGATGFGARVLLRWLESLR